MIFLTFLPETSDNALISGGLHYGYEVPKLPTGKVDFNSWDKQLKGEVVPK